MIGEGAAALEHHVLVKVETGDQFLWRAWLFGQSPKAFSKRGVVKEQEGQSQPLSTCAGPPAIPGWLCRHCASARLLIWWIRAGR